MWWTIENPSNSLFWQTSFWLRVVNKVKNFVTAKLQNCAYGGSRPKWTSFVGSLPNLDRLSKICPGNHKHAPWGLVQKGNSKAFATAAEAESILPNFVRHLQSWLKKRCLPKGQFLLQKPWPMSNTITSLMRVQLQVL